MGYGSTPRDAFCTLLIWGPILAFIAVLVLLFTDGLARFEVATYGTEMMLPNDASPHRSLRQLKEAQEETVVVF